jgi:hypothetical protein
MTENSSHKNAEPHTPLHATSNRLAGWLFSDTVVRREPPHDGAVISWLDADGTCNSLYPEIAGYHLQFCSLHGHARKPQSYVARIANWLDRIAPEGNPPTVILSRDQNSDWRNSALFSFDLCIILRGLRSAEAKFPNEIPAGLSTRYLSSILRMKNAGQLAPHIIRGAEPIPEKWSTTTGIYQVKAAGALASLQSDRMWALACDTAEARWYDFEVTRGVVYDPHPLLYFVEGWLIFWGIFGKHIFAERARRAFATYLDQHMSIAPSALRGDVLAQSLRAGTILQATEVAEPRWNALSAELLLELLSRINEDGSIRFNPEGHKNAWATLFSWQALRIVDCFRAGRLRPRETAAAII